MGRNSAAAEGLPVRFEQADLNHVELPRAEFDLVFCHAALHHVLELERLANQIRGALKPGGELAVVDIISRNGYRMWPETRKLVRSLWATLPPRYRVNHTRRGCPVDARIWEADTRRTGMECARSEEILPVLRRHFQQKLFVGYQAFCRRFFNTMYGPNYDVGRALDRAIVDWIWELDCECVRSQDLKPESFFGIFGEHAQAQSQ
jgi:SAM-dependent methyltransferase